MPRSQANKANQPGMQGLITEAGPLTFPENATVDELNCELFIKGNRSRRLGMDLEIDFSLSDDSVVLATWDDYAINSTVWDTVGGDGNTNFMVQQIGDKLYFYDLDLVPKSTAEKTFTVDLTTFAAPSATSIHTDVVSTASGKGFLFVAGAKIEPFYITYDSVGDSISTTEVTVEIRDFDGLDDSLEPEEEPATLSKEHEYNLKNQGWLSPGGAVPDPITAYQTAVGNYPPNNKQWWTAKNSTDDFDPVALTKFSAGNTLAPRGHYILDAFNKDRTTASGVAAIALESVVTRPGTTAFFAGRVFWAGLRGGQLNGHVYFTQIIEDEAQIGRCYQQNDPTAEDLNELLATDGGVVVIPEIGTVQALFPMKTSLILLANNGTWAISGVDDSFKATDFRVRKISSISCIGPQTVVDVEGFPIWWSRTGINAINIDQVSAQPEVQNLAKQTIQTFFNEIPEASKIDCKGAYDEATKKVIWLYRETAQTGGVNRFRFDRLLVLDTRLPAFYPWKVSTLPSTPYYIGSVFPTPDIEFIVDILDVFDDEEDVNDSALDVIESLELAPDRGTSLMYMVFQEGVTNVQWTFGRFTSTTFFDWNSANGVGVSFDSFFEMGDELLQDLQHKKQAKYIHVYFNRTEINVLRQSSCFMQAKWDFADSEATGKIGPRQQVYKFRDYPVTVSKNKIRGSGRALALRFESEEGKDFDILGWATSWTATTED